jgi:hypothetical protein
MPRPADMDTDPYAARITWAVGLRVDLDRPIGGTPAAFAETFRARLTQRAGGVQGVTAAASPPAGLDAAGPDVGVDPDFWVAWGASALASMGRTGVVTLAGTRARVT